MGDLPALVEAGGGGGAGFVLALLALLLWGWPRLVALARPQETQSQKMRALGLPTDLKKELDTLRERVSALESEDSATVSRIESLLESRLGKPVKPVNGAAQKKSQAKRED